MQCAEILQEGLKRLRLTLNQAAIEALCLYFAELTKWSGKMNLVAPAPAQQILESHFLDSLTLLPLLTATDLPKMLLDVGSGAGFPGLALKTVLPELSVTLIEPRQKRVSFLKHIIRTLGLKDVAVLAIRLEKVKPAAELPIPFPLITSRAFTSTGEFLDLAEPLCQPGGRVICMKGPKAPEEIESWRQKNPASVFSLTEIQRFTLPFSKATRNLVIFTKELPQGSA